ncbi:MAG: class I poly(R)-hydroxyalkanoic acid synthase [Proteobacteria bacterium]|nr:class I poly(R)-hydroxyalkanoic acid synthase [Pseudomonadota bacterium]
MAKDKDTQEFNLNKLSELMIKFSDKQKSVMSALSRSPREHDYKKDISLMSDFGEMMMKLAGDTQTLLSSQQEYMRDLLKLSDRFGRKLMGIDSEEEGVPEALTDKRFRSDEWGKNPFFEFIRDSYLISARNITQAVSQVKGLDEKKKKRVEFFTKQLLEAASPSNYLATNPELLKLTLETGGGNILEGMDNFLNDVDCHDGSLSIKMTATQSFEVGKNLATTPGKVVFQNDLVQLIQYTPTTENVFATPVLISPPWINKFYILDINETSSLVKWLVDQGYTVFMISWVNPNRQHANKTFDDYMCEGHIDVLDVIKKITKQPKVSAIGYCTGGTLLSCTAAYLAAKGEDRFASLTYMATLIDFSYPGDLGIFLDEEQVEHIVADVNNVGYLDGRHLAKTFNMLRPTDLIWSYAVNNYLKGKEPVPFDILYWNSDSTNLPARMYSFYLNNTYIENRLKDPKGISMNGVPISISDIKTPSYFLSTEDDHIVLWKGAYRGARLHSGPTRFVLGGSGHVAGVANPPSKNKYSYKSSDLLPEDPDEWLVTATREAGSWWPNWHEWNLAFAGDRVTPRTPGKGPLKAIEDAPGSYVKQSLEKQYKCRENCSCKKPSRSGLTQIIDKQGKS